LPIAARDCVDGVGNLTYTPSGHLHLTDLIVLFIVEASGKLTMWLAGSEIEKSDIHRAEAAEVSSLKVRVIVGHQHYFSFYNVCSMYEIVQCVKTRVPHFVCVFCYKELRLCVGFILGGPFTVRTIQVTYTTSKFSGFRDTFRTTFRKLGSFIKRPYYLYTRIRLEYLLL
jgi:hypothetical protein